jgi:hypothetical protein
MCQHLLSVGRSRQIGFARLEILTNEDKRAQSLRESSARGKAESIVAMELVRKRGMTFFLALLVT